MAADFITKHFVNRDKRVSVCLPIGVCSGNYLQHLQPKSTRHPIRSVRCCYRPSAHHGPQGRASGHASLRARVSTARWDIDYARRRRHGASSTYTTLGASASRRSAYTNRRRNVHDCVSTARWDGTAYDTDASFVSYADADYRPSRRGSTARWAPWKPSRKGLHRRVGTQEEAQTRLHRRVR